MDDLTLKKHFSTSQLEAEFSRVIMLNAEPPLIPENEQVSQDLVAGHELAKGV